MQSNNCDKTLKKNWIHKYQFLISEYELVKQGLHKEFKTVGSFYNHHGTCRQTFLKYYGRYKNNPESLESLLPGKRGPKYGSRRPSTKVEEMVLQERDKGCNKYEINLILKESLDSDLVPSPSGIYNILKRYGKNKLERGAKSSKTVRIMKELAGELGHIDSYHLAKDTIDGDNNKYHIVGVIDSCTRIVWAEVVDDIKSISVMFASMHCFKHMQENYDIKFAEILTDNGPEFGPRQSQRKKHHPFERLLMEMEVKHRYIKPYRPQTNGKIERFWKTMYEDLIEGTYFGSIDHFKEELYKYLVYYNRMRPHQGLNGKTPDEANQSCQRIT